MNSVNYTFSLSISVHGCNLDRYRQRYFIGYNLKNFAMSPILTKQNLFRSGIYKSAHPNYFRINFIHLAEARCSYCRHDVNQIHVHILQGRPAVS